MATKIRHTTQAKEGNADRLYAIARKHFAAGIENRTGFVATMFDTVQTVSGDLSYKQSVVLIRLIKGVGRNVSRLTCSLQPGPFAPTSSWRINNEHSKRT